MLRDYLTSFGNGIENGIDRAVAFLLQDPSLNASVSSDQVHPRFFRAGQIYGGISGGLVTFVFIDVPSLGMAPLYNYYRNRRDARTSEQAIRDYQATFFGQ